MGHGRTCGASDYYRQSEWTWSDRREGVWREERAGFAAVASEYLDHLGDVPVMLTETNYFGTPEERIAWHREMVAEYCKLRNQGVDLRGYCWYPLFSSVDFQHMLLENRGDVDPVGFTISTTSGGSASRRRLRRRLRRR